MDYYAIGQRIRKYRKAYNMSQEQLAEAVGISTTHMSHIETGNTKLSLPVLVQFAKVLSVQTDAILFNQPAEKTTLSNELSDILDHCSPKELRIIIDIVKTTKTALDKHLSY